jgi:hypothetical protein
MAALSKTYSFTAGTAIVAAQMNENFDDVVDWATGTPTLSTSGSATTVSGTLAVTEATTLSTTLAVTGLSTFSNDVYLAGSNQRVVWEGSVADGNETFLAVTNPTAARTITLPDATGTVALTSDITTAVTAVTGTAPIVSSGGYTPAISITTNDAQLILNNTVFN